jgi:signal transduction histidine kinase
MLQDVQKPVQHKGSVFTKPAVPWIGSFGLAVAIGVAYYLAARLSLLLLTKPDGVAVFWPAAGVATGALIALGPSARFPVAAGAFGATIVAHLLAGDPFIWAAIGYGLFNAGEAVLVAWLIERYFGSAFSLGKLPCVLGLVAAAVVGTAISGIGGTFCFVWLQGSPAPFLTTWYHWFAADGLGIVTVAPVLIGLASAARNPPSRTELLDGAVALVALTVFSGLILLLPRESWAPVVSIALVFPFLLWLAARCRPAFSAAAAFIIAITFVLATTFGVGIFGDATLPIAERILTAQAAILAVSLCAFVLAALFSERRESEARLTRSNLMLQREQNNKLMNLEAMAGSIAHEVRQPLVAIATNGSGALRFLKQTPPNLAEVRVALERIVAASHRASEVFDSIRALFGSADLGQEPIDVNAIVFEVLRALRGELDDHGVTMHTKLTSELPLVRGHKGQIQEVLFNLARNAIEAMDAVKDGSRVLEVTTERHGRDEIVVAVRDTGPGIDPAKLDGIFDPFVTTKSHGMGLGLAICRMIIDRHSGKLTASSDGKRGAVFELVLPIETRDNGAAPVNAPLKKVKEGARAPIRR